MAGRTGPQPRSSAIEVQIDIKPGSAYNSINPSSGGVITLAVLTDATFDAGTVDIPTVRFGESGTEAAPCMPHWRT
jgi:hypothetical protein